MLPSRLPLVLALSLAVASVATAPPVEASTIDEAVVVALRSAGVVVWNTKEAWPVEATLELEADRAFGNLTLRALGMGDGVHVDCAPPGRGVCAKVNEAPRRVGLVDVSIDLAPLAPPSAEAWVVTIAANASEDSPIGPGHILLEGAWRPAVELGFCTRATPPNVCGMRGSGPIALEGVWMRGGAGDGGEPAEPAADLGFAGLFYATYCKLGDFFVYVACDEEWPVPWVSPREEP